MEWLQNLNKAIDYIENNLDKEISYDEAARIACCSTTYFQRMFTYAVGISLSEYIRRRKMTQAAFDLQTTKCKVLDIALKYGYASPTSFNRAFQAVHGVSPVSLRRTGKPLTAYLPIRFTVTVSGKQPMSYRIEEKKAMRFVGIRFPLTENMEENLNMVPFFWDKLLKNGQINSLYDLTNEPFGIAGITHSLNNQFYYSVAAASSKAVPMGMNVLEIPAAVWVVFECDGLFKEASQAIFRRFLTEWLPFSGYAYAELPDIEIYPINHDMSESGHFEIWIAIKKVKN